MIRKNILAIALLGIFGLSQAADVENLRTISYLNEPLRLQADIVGEGEITLAAPTEYLRLNHPIPSYDLAINILDQNGQKQLVLTTTEEIESPALTLLLESRDENNRRQLFELPIILDFKPEPTAESMVAEAADSEIVIDGIAVDAPVAATDKVALAEVPTVAKEETKAKSKVDEKSVAVAVKAESEKAKAKTEVAKVEKEEAKAPVKAPTKALPKASNTNPELLKRYSVEKGETLWSIANKVRPANVTPQKMIEIIKANNPSAFTAGGVLRADVTLLIPTETKKVQHKFVTSEDQDTIKDARIGFIYELPEPPVQQVAEPAKVAEPEVVMVEESQEVPVKVVRPVDNGTTTVVMNADLLQDLTPENAQMAEELLVESQKREQADTGVVATVVEVAEPVKAVEPAKEEVAKPVEPPKKRPVYIMPEPEPEPGIVELLFDNIIYIGAGALVLILGLLAVVMRRRKQDDEPKQPKEKKEKVVKAPKEKAEKSDKKGFSLFGKKKDAQLTDAQPKEKKSKGLFGKKKIAEPVVEEMDVVDVQTPIETPVIKSADKVAPVVAATVATAAAIAAEEPKIVKEAPEEIESLDFDLSFDDEAVKAPVKEEAAIDSLDFDLSAMDLDTQVEDTPKPEEDAVTSLDFDLSSLDLGTTLQEPEAKKDDESMDGLDFDLSSLDLGTPLKGTDETQLDADDYGALDFDLSTSDLELTPAVEATPEVADAKETDAFDSLDFDLSDFATPTVEPDTTQEESFDYGTALDFDLGDAKVETPTPTAEVVTEDSFGENNPLFVSQTDLDASPDLPVVEEDTSNDPLEYISFPDLLDNAEDTLANDDIEAEKPVDFGSFLEDEEAGLANLIETSKKSEKDSKIDLSFVADATEDDAGLAFLDSLDLSEEAVLDDPIDSSVKDNVTKSDESVEALHSAIDVPELIDLPEMVETVDATDDSLLEQSSIEPELPEVSVPEITLLEPVIEEPAPVVKSTLIREPELVAPQILSPIEAMVANDADFESEQVKLELAVAYMGFDKSLAKPLLNEVIKDGNPRQVERAQTLLAQID